MSVLSGHTAITSKQKKHKIRTINQKTFISFGLKSRLMSKDLACIELALLILQINWAQYIIKLLFVNNRGEESLSLM